MAYRNIRTDIDQAIGTGGAVWLSYRNNNGGGSTRVVEPRGWENNYVFRAYCHLRGEERHFKISNVIEWQVFASVDSALAREKAQPALDTAEPRFVTAPSAPRRPSPRTPLPSLSKTAFSQVTKSEQWSRFVAYYMDCLVHENRQQYILKAQDLKTFRSTPGEVRRFMQGEIQLVLPNRDDRQSSFARFVDPDTKQPNQVLCLGYPFLVVDQNEIAPLIYVPVDVSFDGESIRLRADEFEISYAALKSLELTEEEISAFVAECDQVRPMAQESIVEALERLLFAKINEIYQAELPRVGDRLQAGSIYEGPALFWVAGNRATTNLIRELEELGASTHWMTAPESLKYLLAVLPEHDYPALQPWEDDPGVYVTPLNQQQLRAVQSVRSEPIVVVTGPPGTGKSQLVLNLIAEAFLNGEKVLFASRNNRAVDVVMDRLQNELRFVGAIRTGNTANREKAVAQMRDALNQLSLKQGKFDPDAIRQSYYANRQEALDTQSRLEKVRNLNGLLLSHQRERKRYLELLPRGLRNTAESNVPGYIGAAAEALQSDLSLFYEQALALKSVVANLDQKLHHLQTSSPSEYALIAEIHHIQDQWGDFGDGFAGRQRFSSVESMIRHLIDWSCLVEWIEKEAELSASRNSLRHLGAALLEKRSEFPDQLIGQDELLAKAHTPGQLETLLEQSQELECALTKFSAGSAPLWQRLHNWLSGGALVRKTMHSLEELRKYLGLPVPASDGLAATERLNASLTLSRETSLVLSTAKLYTDVESAEGQVLSQTEEAQRASEFLPEAVRSDSSRFERYDYNNGRLRLELDALLEAALGSQAQAEQLVDRLNQRLEKGDSQQGMLSEVRSGPAGTDIRLWRLNQPAAPDVIIRHVDKWSNLVSFWCAHSRLEHVEKLLAALPSEKEALEQLEAAQEVMIQLSSKLMYEVWIERAQEVGNDTVQQTYDYVAAVEQLTRRYDPTTYAANKARENSNLAAAAQLFPIWATTNLAARSNFPLTSGFFDLVIIDEASQCDFPSALPLLYRGRRAVIIGDPNQLRHVATLSGGIDQGLASEHGVAIDAFSYNNHSLYDIAQRSAGHHPGALLLDEHYRCDERIIGFSNEEFYGGQLVVRTDLTQKGMRRTFLNQFGGMYWLHVEGKVDYPRGGSLYNSDELKCLQSLLPRLSDWLRQHELEQASIGIVTPYRAQASRIREWVGNYDGFPNVTVGTAHTFQGDEKDFVIFSPVLSNGISEGSVRWLERTRNLLNVAITRARVALLIAGDWNFCQTLDKDHAFCRLADYVARQPQRIASSVTELPLFGKSQIDISGVVLDPHNPRYNRTTLRHFISSCSEFVWWLDVYFNNHIVELWRDVFQDANVNVREVRLLTAREMIEPTDDRKPQLSASRIAQIRSELSSRGIRFDVRCLKKRDLPHDRLLYSPGLAINMPPFAGAYGDHRYVSEYTRSSTTRELFLEHWDKATEITE